MKKLITVAIIIFLSAAFGPTAVRSDEQMGPSVTHSKDYEYLKTFIGVWEGKSDMGKGPETVKVTYELTSAGNAIMERLSAGTPHEMVTIYHDYNGKLAMTHYCSLGNQPHMDLTNSAGGILEFALSEKTPGLASLKEKHMHGLRIAVDGKDGITHTWTLYDNGVKKSDVMIKLNRVRIL